MLCVSTIDNGHPYEWKMDLVGGPALNPIEHPSTQTLKQSLDAIYKRIGAYYSYLDSNYRSGKRQKLHEDPERYKKRLDAEEYSLEVFTDLLSCIGESMKDESSFAKFTPVRELGAIFWSDLEPDFRATDKESDVTYDPKKGYHSIFESGMNTEKHVKVEVYWRKPARRKWGVHIELENSLTIEFINKVLPYISDGWMEIIVKGFNRTYHMKMLPWQEPKTTYVQPFWMQSHNSNWADNPPLEQIMSKPFEEFRNISPGDWSIQKEKPYLISGKGSEIDAMVQSINSLKLADRKTLIEACTIWRKNHFKTEHWSAKQISDIWVKTLTDIRAYYSTDVNKRHGDRSVFFFHLKGFIFGVEMLFPSIPYINLQYDHPIRTLPVRGQRDADAYQLESIDRRRNNSRGRNPANEAPGSRTQSSTPSTSRRSSRGRPPPPGAQNDVPQVVWNKLEEIQKMVQSIEQRQPGPAQGQPDFMKEMQDRFNEMEKKLAEQNGRQYNDEESDNIIKYDEANQSMLENDPAGEWLVAVSENHPQEAPVEILAWGMLDAWETRRSEPKDYSQENPVVFYLDKESALSNGTLLYTTFKNRNNHESGRTDQNFALYPYPEESKGYRSLKYSWIMQYLIDDDEQKKEYKIQKVKNSTVLLSDSSTQCLWKTDDTLQELDRRDKAKQYVNVHFMAKTSGGTVQRKTNWVNINKTQRVHISYNFDLKQFEFERIHQAERILDPNTLVTGVAGHMYWLKMFPDFSPMPDNDRSGLLPSKIEMKIEHLLLLIGPTQSNYHLTYSFTLIDCKQPLYVCYTQHDKRDITLYLGPYYDEKNKKYIWGIKSNCGKEFDPIWIATLPKHWTQNDESYALNRSSLFSCSLDSTKHGFIFNRWIDGRKCSTLEQDIYFKVPVNELKEYKRIPNVPNPNAETEARRLELKGIFSAYTANALNAMFPVRDSSMLKHVQETWKNLEAGARIGKFGLFIYDREFPSFINRDANRLGVPVEFNVAPFLITMDHAYLEGRNREENGRLQLVDVQGPVWVSTSGDYMICPHRDTKNGQDKKCWALFRWDKSKASYGLFATKLNDNLISSREFDARQQSDHTWRFYQQWDGRLLPHGKNDRLTVTMEYNSKAKQTNSSGQKVRPNYYSLFKRLPDFSVDKKEALFTGEKRSLGAYFLGMDRSDDTGREILVDGGNSRTPSQVQEQDRARTERANSERDIEEARRMQQIRDSNGQIDIQNAEEWPSLSDTSRKTIQQAKAANKRQEEKITDTNQILEEIESSMQDPVSLRPTTRKQDGEKMQSKTVACREIRKEALKIARELVSEQNSDFIERYDIDLDHKETENDFKSKAEQDLQDIFESHNSIFNENPEKYTEYKRSIIQSCVEHFMLGLNQRKIAHEREKNQAAERLEKVKRFEKDLEYGLTDWETAARERGMDEDELQLQIRKQKQENDEKISQMEEALETASDTVMLMPPSFTTPTPWLEIMDNYRHFLMEEPAKKDKKKQEWIQKRMRQNKIKEQQDLERAEKDQKDAEERVRKQSENIRKKQEREENFTERFKDQEPKDGTDEFNLLLHCRVFKEQKYWRKVPLELQDVAINEERITFELQSPYRLQYIAKYKGGGAKLCLMPEVMENDKDEEVYAWKLMLIREESLSNPTHVTVAVKWEQPEVLIDPAYTNSWRWRFPYIPNVKDAIIFERMSKSNEINYVWYKDMSFAKVLSILSDTQLPMFSLGHSGVYTTTPERFIYSRDLQSAISNEDFWASVWPLSEIRNKCLSFFEVPTHLYIVFTTGRDPVTFQLNTFTGEDSMDKRNPRDHTEAFYWTNATMKSYFDLKLYPDEENHVWTLAVRKTGRDIPVLSKANKFLLDSQNRWTKATTASTESDVGVQKDFYKWSQVDIESNMSVKTSLAASKLRQNTSQAGNCVRYWAFHMFEEKQDTKRPKYINAKTNECDFLCASPGLEAIWQSDSDDDMDLHSNHGFTSSSLPQGAAASYSAELSCAASSQNNNSWPGSEVHLLPLQSRRQSAAHRSVTLKLTAQPASRTLARDRPLLLNRFRL